MQHNCWRMLKTEVCWSNPRDRWVSGGQGLRGRWRGALSTLTWSTHPSREARMVGWSSRCMCIMRLQRHMGAGALMGTVSDDWPSWPPALDGWPEAELEAVAEAEAEVAELSSTGQATRPRVRATSSNKQAKTKTKNTTADLYRSTVEKRGDKPGKQHLRVTHSLV